MKVNLHYKIGSARPVSTKTMRYRGYSARCVNVSLRNEITSKTNTDTGENLSFVQDIICIRKTVEANAGTSEKIQLYYLFYYYILISKSILESIKGIKIFLVY